MPLKFPHVLHNGILHQRHVPNRVVVRQPLPLPRGTIYGLVAQQVLNVVVPQLVQLQVVRGRLHPLKLHQRVPYNGAMFRVIRRTFRVLVEKPPLVPPPSVALVSVPFPNLNRRGMVVVGLVLPLVAV